MLKSRLVEIVALLLALRLLAFASTQDESDLSLTLTPPSVLIGSTVKLCWSSAGDGVRFISNIGPVPPSGCKDFKPITSTTYTLLLENDRGVLSRSVNVDVRGQKGVDEFPPTEQVFTYPLEGTREGLSFAAFAARLHHVLQDDMKLSVKKEDYDCANSRLTFVTSLHQDVSLIGSSETSIKARRFSYRVDVFRSPRNVAYKIATFVQWERMVEEKWRIDSSDAVHRAITDKLKRAIDTM